MSGIGNTSSNPRLTEPVKATCGKFRKVFQLFGACDKGYSTAKAMDEAGVEKLGMGSYSNTRTSFTWIMSCRSGYQALYGILSGEFPQDHLSSCLCTPKDAPPRVAHGGLGEAAPPWDWADGRTGC